MKIWGTYDSPEALVIKSKMPQMLKLIEEAEQKLKEEHAMDMYEYEDSYWDEYDQSMPEEDYPEGDFYEDWDNLEMGFDPYMGCYSDDC